MAATAIPIAASVTNVLIIVILVLVVLWLVSRVF